MDGRVKTLHPHIHGGLLARRGVDDAVLESHGIGAIDLLGRESLSVRGDDGAARLHGCRGDREHRRRRPCDAARRRQESRAHRGRRRSHGLRAPCLRRPEGWRRPRSNAPAAGDQGVQPHGPLRHGDQPLLAHAQHRARRLGEPAAAELGPHAAAALRRESAPTRGALPNARARAGIGRAGVAAARQGIVVQQPRRCRCRVSGRQGVRRNGVRHREAREPVRHRNCRYAGDGLSARVSHRSDLGVRRRHRVQSPARSIVRGSHRRPAVRRGHHRARSRQGVPAPRSRRSKASACSRRAGRPHRRRRVHPASS